MRVSTSSTASPRADVGLHRQHRLLSGRGRRAADQPDRFNLFFPEKRDFFLENSGIFQFGPGRPPGRRRRRRRRRPAEPVAGHDLLLQPPRSACRTPARDPDSRRHAAHRRRRRVLGRRAQHPAARARAPQPADRTSRPSGSAGTPAQLRHRRHVAEQGRERIALQPRVGVDANFRFLPGSRINALSRRPSRPRRACRRAATTGIPRVHGISYRDNFWDSAGAPQTIGTRFNDEMGFVPRTGVNKTELYLGAHIRPKARAGGCARPSRTVQFVSISPPARRRAGIALHGLSLAGDAPEQRVHRIRRSTPTPKSIREPFTINTRRGIQVQPGRYQFNENFVLVNTNQRRPLSFNAALHLRRFLRRLSPGYNIGATLRRTSI